MFNDIHFEYAGFRPDLDTRRFIATIAENLHISAPSDSITKFAFQVGKDAVRASCRIVSQAGTFVADTISDNPIRAVQQLEEKINDQINHWKTHRFV